MTSSIPAGSALAALEQYSFSDEAAQIVRSRTGTGVVRYQKTIDGVWDAVRGGDTGLIPFENSSAGVVWPHLDRLSREEKAEIVGEVRLKVRMCAGGVRQDALAAAEIACSHPKGNDQTSDFFRRHGLRERKDFPTTVAAVEHVKRADDPKNIALASRLAITELGLHLVGEDVANLKGEGNVTQFFAIRQNGGNGVPQPEALYHAAILTPHNQRGVLNRLTSMIDNARVDLHSIHSRSIGTKEYSFYLEMQREGTPEEFALLSSQLAIHPLVKSVRWLGSWDDRFENE